jgi:preprotein translocase subunit SecA
MMGGMRSEVCTGLFRSSTNLAAFENMLSSLSGVAKTTGPESGNAGFDNFKGGQGGPAAAQQESEAPQIATPVVRDAPKVGRNDPCPCGSGKKYKKCCGAGVAA